MDSGIKVEAATVQQIQDLEQKRTYEFLIMQIAVPEGKSKPAVVTKEILNKQQCLDEVEAAGVELQKGETASWYCFRTRLEKYDICYGACFIDYKTGDGRDGGKLMFITWNTDNAKMAEKMKYSSTKVLNKFNSGPTKHQAADKDDVTYLEIVERKLNRK